MLEIADADVSLRFANADFCAPLKLSHLIMHANSFFTLIIANQKLKKKESKTNTQTHSEKFDKKQQQHTNELLDVNKTNL